MTLNLMKTHKIKNKILIICGVILKTVIKNLKKMKNLNKIIIIIYGKILKINLKIKILMIKKMIIMISILISINL